MALASPLPIKEKVQWLSTGFHYQNYSNYSSTKYNKWILRKNYWFHSPDVPFVFNRKCVIPHRCRISAVHLLFITPITKESRGNPHPWFPTSWSFLKLLSLPSNDTSNYGVRYTWSLQTCCKDHRSTTIQLEIYTFQICLTTQSSIPVPNQYMEKNFSHNDLSHWCFFFLFFGPIKVLLIMIHIWEM